MNKVVLFGVAWVRSGSKVLQPLLLCTGLVHQRVVSLVAGLKKSNSTRMQELANNCQTSMNP